MITNKEGLYLVAKVINKGSKNFDKEFIVYDKSIKEHKVRNGKLPKTGLNNEPISEYYWLRVGRHNIPYKDSDIHYRWVTEITAKGVSGWRKD